MAIKKNKDGILAAISAATEPISTQTLSKDRAQRSLPRGTIGSVRAGLGGIQEIDTDLILPWGPPDRLDPELTAVNSEVTPESVEDLARSISTSGQQLPILLRPSREQDGYFEVVYGRRRILACKQLGIAVKALIRTLDDTEALMAKGLENASRKDLSFYERARFATAIIAQGYDRATACEALSVSKNTLSQLERVTRFVPDAIGDAIGSAPESGRPKWMALAQLFEGGNVSEEQSLKALDNVPADFTSDDRLSHLLKATTSTKISSKTAPNKKQLADIGSMTVASNAIKINLAKDHGAGFSKFLEAEMPELIARYKAAAEKT